MPDDWQKNLAPENVQIHSASPLVVIVFRFRLRLPAQFAQEAHRPGLLDHIVVVTLGILFSSFSLAVMAIKNIILFLVFLDKSVTYYPL